MYGRETGRKQGVKRGLVALLSLAILLGLCVPGLTVAFGEQEADLTVTRGTSKVYSGAEYTEGTHSEPKGLRLSSAEGGILVEAPEGLECGTYVVMAGEGKSFTVAVVSGSGTPTDQVDKADQSDQTDTSGETVKPVEGESVEDSKEPSEESSSGDQNPEGNEDGETGSTDGTNQPDDASGLPAAGETDGISSDPLPADNAAVPGLADTAAPLAIGDVSADFAINAQNATIAYSYRRGTNEWSPLQEIASGESLHYDAFRTLSEGGYILFFVKPDENHLMTYLSGNESTFGDRYPIDGPYGNINFADGASCVDEAKAAGYVSVLGYSRVGTYMSPINAPISATCVEPTIGVEAVSDKTENVKPGDELTFTITVTPETGASFGSADSVQLTNVTINGEHKQVTLSGPDGNGQWTGTLSYTATQGDCDAGAVILDVESVAYYTVNYKVSNNQTVTTKSAVTSSANVVCYIAPKGSVRYGFTFDSNAPARPENFPSAPEGLEGVFQGQDVTVDTTFQTGQEVLDEVNGGKWILGDGHSTANLLPKR